MSGGREFKEGDLILAVKGELKIEGRLVRFAESSPILNIDGAGWTLKALTHEKFTITLIKPAPAPLPTEDGVYESEGYPIAEGFTAYELREGVWSYNGFSRPLDAMAQVAPLHRLERTTVTAKKVIDRFSELWQKRSPGDVLAELEREFGVTK